MKSNIDHGLFFALTIAAISFFFHPERSRRINQKDLANSVFKRPYRILSNSKSPWTIDHRLWTR